MACNHNRLAQLPDLLLGWFYENKRQLPWREDREPYHIWVSEIMLQQTRVEAVKAYYSRFMQKLPTLEQLAACPDEQLEKLWEGLGYYSRVRNLKKAASIIIQEHSGQFPKSYDQLRKLPGIGDYTAGAICSIAYDQKTPAVDGNVLRVFSRLTDDPTPVDSPQMKKKVTQQLRSVYPEQAGDFTQALMELGATVCGPNRRPDCRRCPCREICLAFQNGTAESLPVKAPKKSRRQQELTVFILCCEGSYALEKRKKTGLLAGLWQFPNTQGFLSPEQAVEFLEKQNIPVKNILRQTEKKHIFTHIQWNIRGFYMEIEGISDAYCWFTANQIENEAALPTAFRQFWTER